MVASGTYGFNIDILDVIEEAYELGGREVQSGYDLKTARRSLDLLMREWGNRGINFWTIEEATEAIAAGQQTVNLDDWTIDILEAVWRTGTGTQQNDRTMTRMSVTEWAETANKNDPGSPTRFWVNRKITPVVYIWPTPVQDGTFAFWRIRNIQDAGDNTNNMEVPTRFLPALTTGLAYYLALKNQNVGERLVALKSEYDRQFQLAAEEDRERASLFLVPDNRGC